MTFEVAKKAIDEYIQLYNGKLEFGYMNKPAIAFFGGEPFLKFDIIKQVIDYCDRMEYDITYMCTTNGTIMTEEIINYIVNHDFTITFSLDGYKEQHDRNRIYMDKKGSFEVIYSNILRLQKYKKKRNIKQSISFSCTFDDYSDLIKITEFYKENSKVFEPYSILYSPVNRCETTYFKYCDELYKKGILKNNHKTAKETYKVLFKRMCSSETSLHPLFTSLAVLHNRLKGRIELNSTSCIPTNKITVDCFGNYYICERINQKFKIGDIYKGVNWDRCNELLEKFVYLLNTNCSSCNLSRLCDICFVHFVTDENNLKFNNEECLLRKKHLPGLLSELYTLLECNSDLLNYTLKLGEL